MVGTKMLLRTTLVSALVGGFMLFSITPKILADDRDSCYRNVENWEQNWIATLTATASIAGRPTTTGTNSAKHGRVANGDSATTGESTTTTIVIETSTMIVTTTATASEFEMNYPCSTVRRLDTKENGPPVDRWPVVTS